MRLFTRVPFDTHPGHVTFAADTHGFVCVVQNNTGIENAMKIQTTNTIKKQKPIRTINRRAVSSIGASYDQLRKKRAKWG
jgi:hypothetical protein